MYLAYAKLNHRATGTWACTTRFDHCMSNGVGCLQKIDVCNFVVSWHQHWVLYNCLLNCGKSIRMWLYGSFNSLKRFNLFLPFWIFVDCLFQSCKIRNNRFQLQNQPKQEFQQQPRNFLLYMSLHYPHRVDWQSCELWLIHYESLSILS